MTELIVLLSYHKATHPEFDMNFMEMGNVCEAECHMAHIQK